MRRISPSCWLEAVREAGLQQTDQSIGVFLYGASLPDGGDDSGNTDLHQGLIIVTGEELRLVGDLLDGGQHSAQLIHYQGVVQREQISSLGEILLLQNLLEQSVHDGVSR